MLEQLDKQIAELEARLAALRQQKLAALQAQMTALQAAMSGAAAIVLPTGPNKGGRPRKDGLPAGSVKLPVVAPGGLPPAPVRPTGPKKRGRRPGKRIPDEVHLETLKALVVAAGKDGISAREAALRSNIFYPKAISIMKKNFKAQGTGKWTRYTLK